MSDVKRYRTAGLGELPACAHWSEPEVVLASDYTAQSLELQAVREALVLARPYVAWQVDNTNTARAELTLIDAALKPSRGAT